MWKKEVLCSPSRSQLMQDFCSHYILSCFMRSASLVRTCCSWRVESSILPLVMICCWSCSISCSKRGFLVNMFPKVCLFQCLRCYLSSFNLVWNLCMREIPATWLFCHHLLIISWKSGWVSQKISNRNDFLFASASICQWKHIDQWSKPATGRMVELISSFQSMICSEIRKRSSLEAIWAALPLQLF